MPQRIQLRRGTASEWNLANPVLASGEVGVEQGVDSVKMKVGDGTTPWDQLDYFSTETGSLTASEIVFVPVGTIGSTDLQSAVAEVASEGIAALVSEAAARASADALLIPLTQKGAANGVATLGSDSKIPGAQLPALAISETFVVNSQSAMLALTAQRGDVAVRTDLTPDGFFLLTSDSPSTLADWVQITSGGTVLSVDGQTGAVDLTDTYVQAAIVTETPGATVTLDLSDGKTRRYVTLEEDTTLAVDNDDAQPLFIVIVDTGAGGSALTFWDGIQWATEGGAAPTVTPEAEARDVFSFIKLGVGDYLGFVVGQGLAIPVPLEVPDAPTSIVATAGNTTADVAFTPGDDGGSARTGCRITPYIGATAQTPQVFATTATTQTLTGLTNGATYTFKVEDKNAVGYSALSTASNSVTPIATTPLYPALDLYPSLSLYPAA